MPDFPGRPVAARWLVLLRAHAMALRAFVDELDRLEEEAPEHSGGRRARPPRARTRTESPAPR